MILLERIIPYSKQIRGMQESLQAYYEARSEIEIAKNEFQKEVIRENIDIWSRIIDDAPIILLEMPTLNSTNTGDYVVISNHKQLPLQIKMYKNDANPRGFGTSQKNTNFHNFSSYGGGLLFDLSEINTTQLSVITTTDDANASKNGNISVEFIHSSGFGTTPFFWTVGDKANPNLLQRKNIATAKDTNRDSGWDTLTFITNQNNCLSASCSLKLQLIDSPKNMIPVSFSLSVPIPDLNAVVVADGLSKNASYHTRIIELIPLIQSI